MTDNGLCPNCGAQLAQDFKEALCPQCLMKLALSKGDQGESSPSSTTKFPSLPTDWENPEQIGPYRILEALGEGGMGIVYLAEQREPIRRRVALKVIKLGMDTKEVIARFESERQALALMNHPNIAKVLDAGSTESGRPYFVMDYVSGIPITEYCDDHRLDTKARLRLFLPVCKAIEHAHQKGIIHRDIKPSNVLVELQDGEPTPKVIDFGVSKATNQRLTERTIFTQRGVLIGTPGYMSPEQTEMTPLDVDTRTDIYSLGVLLYEVLVGVAPFDPTELLEAGFDEMRRIIREEKPQPLVTKLHSLGDTASEIAHQRCTKLSRLSAELKGNLEWITLKAMEKDRSVRYPRASKLAEEIDHHLRGEPIVARSTRLHVALRKLEYAVLISLLAFTITALFSSVSPLLHRLDLKSYDFLMASVRGPVAPPDNILIVAIDEASLREYALKGIHWPWPESVYGQLLTKASQEGARAVIFAFFLGSEGLSTGEFASSISHSKCPVILETVTAPSLDPEWTILPAESLIAAGAQTGFSHLHPDIDSVVRRTRLFAQGAPSLVAQTYSLVVGSPLDVDRLPIAGFQDSDPEILINFHGGGRHTRTTSYGVALDKPAPYFHNKIILVRSPLVGRFPGIAGEKTFATPFSSDPLEGQPTEYTATLSLMTKVEVQANALSTLLRENFIYTPGPLTQHAAALLIGFLVSFVTFAARRGSLAFSVVSGGIAVYLVVVAALFNLFSQWVRPAAPLCVVLLSLVLTLIYRKWRA